MNVLLTGANGFIGRNLASALTAAGHRVIPASRGSGIDFCRMLAPQDWRAHLRGVDAVINSVGIIGESGAQRFEPLHTLAPSALFQACAEAGVRRVLQISALGADDTAFSAYHLSKRAADDCLRGLDLDWFVLRPSLVYGLGGASVRLFMALAKLPLIPVIGSGRQRVQPVHISDVVATIMRGLTSPEPRQTLDVVGPETMTFADWLQTMRRAQGLRPAPLLRVPYQLALLATHVGRYFSPMLQAENLHMLQTGNCADPQPLIRFLGRAPLPVETRLFFTDAASTEKTS